MGENTRKRGRIGMLAMAAAAACLQMSHRALGANDTWTSGSGTWTGGDIGDWSLHQPPQAGDNAFITDDDATSRIITYGYTGSAITLGSLTIDNDGPGTNTLSMTSSGTALVAGNEYLGDSNTSNLPGWGVLVQSVGSNAVTNALYLGYGADDAGFYTLNGTTGTLDSANEYVGYSGAGSFNQGGNTTNVAGDRFVLGDNSGSSGTYTMTGGLLETGDIRSTEIVGNNGTGSVVQSGGINNFSDGFLYVGYGASGSYTLSGTGTLTASSAVFESSLNIGANSGVSGTFILQTGGLVSLTGVVSENVGGTSFGAGGSGTLNVSGGQMTVGGTLQVWNTTGTSVMIGGGSVTAGNTVNLATITQTGGISSLGTLSGTGSISVGNLSGASAAMTVTALTQNSVTVDSTGTLKMIGGASNNTINKLTIIGSGIFDITNGHFFIDYAGGSDPTPTIRGYLAFGYARGAWNGPGINSSIAALPANSHYGIGYADYADGIFIPGLSSGQIEVKYTLYGDANLDGVVDGSDFTILAGNLGKSVTAWDKGDFNYDGVVNATDFTLLVGNLGKSASGADVVIPAADYAAIDAFAAANGLMADVPEPTAIGWILFAGFGMLMRRIRSARC